MRVSQAQAQAQALRRLPVMLPHEALECVPEVLGLFEHLCLGVHEGIDLRPPLGAAQLILPVDRSRLFVKCVELPGERCMVIGEGAELLHSLCACRIRVGPGVYSDGLHQAALLSLGIREGAAMRAVYLSASACGAHSGLASLYAPERGIGATAA
jgi:hypothetical protein